MLRAEGFIDEDGRTTEKFHDAFEGLIDIELTKLERGYEVELKPKSD